MVGFPSFATPKEKIFKFGTWKKPNFIKFATVQNMNLGLKYSAMSTETIAPIMVQIVQILATV